MTHPQIKQESHKERSSMTWAFAPRTWCRRGDLNPYALAGTSPSSWRVCLFRHSDVDGRV